MFLPTWGLELTGSSEAGTCEIGSCQQQRVLRPVAPHGTPWHCIHCMGCCCTCNFQGSIAWLRLQQRRSPRSVPACPRWPRCAKRRNARRSADQCVGQKKLTCSPPCPSPGRIRTWVGHPVIPTRSIPCGPLRNITSTASTISKEGQTQGPHRIRRYPQQHHTLPEPLRILLEPSL